MEFVLPLTIILIASAIFIPGVLMIFKERNNHVDTPSEKNKSILIGVILTVTAIIFALLSTAIAIQFESR